MDAYNYLKEFSCKGYPFLNNENYEKVVVLYSKEELVDAFCLILMENKNKPIPFPVVSCTEVDELFLGLQEKEEGLIKDDTKKVWTKHNYDFDLKNYYGTIQLGHYYNNVSNFFHREERYKCGGHNRISPVEVWNGANMSDEEWKKKLKGFVSPLFRSVNNLRKVEEGEYMFCFRLSSTVYTAPQFRPSVAKLIYDKFAGNGNVIDFSMGWGDRLSGFFSSKKTKKYLGTDPNIGLHQGYNAQINSYSKNIQKEVEIYKDPAEDHDWGSHLNYDLIFTSPPYFSTERYAKGTSFENHQSWSRYKTNNTWLDSFLFPVLEKTFGCLNKRGTLAINIFDVELKKNKREYICEPMIRYCEKLGYKYNGYIGMRMKQRPKQFKSDKDKSEFMSSYYVEPIWIFEKE